MAEEERAGGLLNDPSDSCLGRDVLLWPREDQIGNVELRGNDGRSGPAALQLGLEFKVRLVLSATRGKQEVG